MERKSSGRLILERDDGGLGYSSSVTGNHEEVIRC